MVHTDLLKPVQIHSENIEIRCQNNFLKTFPEILTSLKKSVI